MQDLLIRFWQPVQPAASTDAAGFCLRSFARAAVAVVSMTSVATCAVAQQTPETSVARLIAAYPDHLDRINDGMLIWTDGTRMAINDGHGAKTHADRLATADVKDMFTQPYVSGPLAKRPERDDDPGRARNAALFDKMYGDCRKGGVVADLVDVVWLPKKWGKTVKVTKINGVADKLKAVSVELDALPSSFDKFLHPIAGTFACRVIAGSDRTSAHGHGIAIDLALRHAHYWQWDAAKAGAVFPYRNAIPSEIVEIFERHGFIWGGKWYHYDTMHFEYRPELLLPR